MGRRRLRTLSASDLASLPHLAGQEFDPADPFGDHLAWAHAAVDRFGLCGVALVDADVLGWLLVSTALNLPSGHPLSRGSRSADAAQLLQVCVEPEHRGAGLGTQMVQHVAGHLVEQVGAIEALGHPGPGTAFEPPASWLLTIGFTAVDGSSTLNASTRMRLDLSRTVRWRPAVKGALDRLAGLARPASSPWPAPSARAPRELLDPSGG